MINEDFRQLLVGVFVEPKMLTMGVSKEMAHSVKMEHFNNRLTAWMEQEDLEDEDLDLIKGYYNKCYQLVLGNGLSGVPSVWEAFDDTERWLAAESWIEGAGKEWWWSFINLGYHFWKGNIEDLPDDARDALIFQAYHEAHLQACREMALSIMSAETFMGYKACKQ